MVFDFGEVFAAIHKKMNGPLYFRTDTHWLPETMHAAAESLSSFLVDSGYVKPTARIPFRTERTIVTNSGDITEMLRLPSDQLLYPPEEVIVRRILMTDGTPWRSDRSSKILFLGDSFSNIFSLGDMGWGESAGFVEQLSYELGETVDAVLRNDNGSFATRKVIYDESARGGDRLEGKRIVLYQFATRELSQGDWVVYESFVSNKTADVFFCPNSGTDEIVSAKIKSISPVPRPFSVPYKDHIVTLHLIDVRAESGDDIPAEALVYMWSMRNNELTAAASLRPGQSIHLRLFAWSDVSDNLERINRGELMDMRLLSAEPCWGDLL
jgi:alginate O-acetyltransferase complex protein AlgJ